MKKNLLKLSLTAAALALTSSAVAQTTWTGNTNTAVNTAGNWTNGLPTSSGNPGTVNSGAGSLVATFTYSNYFVTQNGGTLTSTNSLTLNNGSWTLNSGGAISSSNTISLQALNDGHQDLIVTGGTLSRSNLVVSSTGTNRSAHFNMSGGDVDLTGRLTLTTGGIITVSGGTLDMNDARIEAGTFNISGGAVTAAADFGRGGAINLTGGSLSINELTTFTGFKMTLGGSSAGTFTADKFADGFQVASRNFDWLSGTKMTMTLSGSATWAETEWTANRMFFNGDSGTVLGLTWAQVSDKNVGFNSGGGTYFDWDSTTNTLALVTIPEPSTSALVAIVLGFIVVFRRRRA